MGDRCKVLWYKSFISFLTYVSVVYSSPGRKCPVRSEFKHVILLFRGDVQLASIVKRQPGGCPRPIYYYHETFRVKIDPEASGKGPRSGKSVVKSRDIYLGTAEEVLKKCTAGQLPQEVSKREFGLVCAALEVAREVGIAEAIDEVLPQAPNGLTPGQYMLIGVLKKICTSTGHSGLRDWFESTALPRNMGIDPGLLASQNFWQNFELLATEKDCAFSADRVAKMEQKIWERLIQKYNVTLDAVLYEMTGLHTFPWLARGGLPRPVGLVLGVTREAQLPLFHKLFYGKKQETGLFTGAVEELAGRLSALSGAQGELTAVVSRGNNSPENMKKIHQRRAWVAGRLEPANRPTLCRVQLNQYRETVDGKPVYSTEAQVFGATVKVAVVYDERAYRHQKRELRREIERMHDKVLTLFRKNKHHLKDQIKELIQELIQDSDYGRYFDLEVGGRRHKVLHCRLNRKAYRHKLRTLGKTIIFSDNLTLSARELLQFHLEKDRLEEDFRSYHDPSAQTFRPLHSWTDGQVRVYTLLCVLALLVQQLMNHRVRQAGLSMGNAELKAELSDICEIVLSYSNERLVRKLTRRTGVQEGLFQLFNLTKYVPVDPEP